MTFEKSSYTDIELRIAMVKSGLKSQQAYVLMLVFIAPYFVIYLLTVFTKIFDNYQSSIQLSKKTVVASGIIWVVMICAAIRGYIMSFEAILQDIESLF